MTPNCPICDCQVTEWCPKCQTTYRAERGLRRGTVTVIYGPVLKTPSKTTPATEGNDVVGG